MTLNCNEVISVSESVISYEWYKDNSPTKVPNENGTRYHIGNQRNASGNYTCKVVAKNSGTSIQSMPQAIEFYCKFEYRF